MIQKSPYGCIDCPVDGIIITDTVSIDESMLTGESLPNDKKPEITYFVPQSPTP